MKRRDFINTVLAGGMTGMAGRLLPGCSAEEEICMTGDRVSAGGGKPNVVIILTDDQGYGDLGCYDAQGYDTPNIDRLARRGVRFTDFYASSPLCSPTRASLLTGCYPQRVGIFDPLNPDAKHGINASELTLSESLRAAGYRTGCFGKWHLGHEKEFLPTSKGFDEFFGLPYSNDMIASVPENSHYGFPEHLPVIEGDSIYGYDPDQSLLTTRYTERAVRFIRENRGGPFFLYLPHSMPHAPINVSSKFKGKSKIGMYGDVMMEIDWSVGQVMSTLEQLGLEQDTIVLYASDNGPALSYGDWGGSAGHLREGKGTTFEGGMRVPFIMHWPGQLPSGGICRELATVMDIFPTLAELVGAPMPTKEIDGKNIWSLTRRGATPHEAFYYYFTAGLEAVRSGRWKLHLPHRYSGLEVGGKGGVPGTVQEMKISNALFDLSTDPGERRDLAAQNPRVVAQLLTMAEGMRHRLGDVYTQTKGTGQRPAGGYMPEPKPPPAL